MDIVGIILAAGKGTRFKAKSGNKTSQNFLGKPLIVRGVELFQSVARKIVVVVGDNADSVKRALEEKGVIYAYQAKRLGTGHALKIAMEEIERQKTPPELIVLGYGDHLMCYKRETLAKLVASTRSENVVIAMITTTKDDPNEVRWGRVVRDKDDRITGIVEQKDATPTQRKIKELNAGLYCITYGFARKAVKKLKKSKVSGEYYATDLVGIAVDTGHDVVGVKVPFVEVGYGANTKEELQKTEKLLSN